LTAVINDDYTILEAKEVAAREAARVEHMHQGDAKETRHLFGSSSIQDGLEVATIEGESLSTPLVEIDAIPLKAILGDAGKV